jgi:hypothetical protein
MVSAMDTTTGANFFILKMHIDNFKVEEGASATEDEISASNSFLFYPNPLSGSKLYLKSPQDLIGNIVRIQISDPQGRILQRDDIIKTDLQKGMNVSLPPGIYFIQWTTDQNKKGTEKLIVQ